MKKIDKRSLEQLFEDCIDNDSEEEEYIDPVQLALETEVPDCLAGKNMEFVQNENSNSLVNCGFNIGYEDYSKIMKQLQGYSVVGKIEDLMIGRYVRWMIPLKSGGYKLSNGAFAVSVRDSILNDAKLVLCRNTSNQFLQVLFMEGLMFQQLSKEELMILMISSRV